MLVLTRKPEEAIVLEGGLVRIRVLEVKGHQVRIGIDAPADVVIDREEVHERKKQEARTDAS